MLTCEEQEAVLDKLLEVATSTSSVVDQASYLGNYFCIDPSTDPEDCTLTHICEDNSDECDISIPEFWRDVALTVWTTFHNVISEDIPAITHCDESEKRDPLCDDCQAAISNFVENLGMESIQVQVIANLQEDGYCNQQNWTSDYECEPLMADFLPACIRAFQTSGPPPSLSSQICVESIGECSA